MVAGQSASVAATLNALIADPSANAILTLPGPFAVGNVAVGYNNGFWMILIH